MKDDKITVTRNDLSITAWAIYFAHWFANGLVEDSTALSRQRFELRHFELSMCSTWGTWCACVYLVSAINMICGICMNKFHNCFCTSMFFFNKFFAEESISLKFATPSILLKFHFRSLVVSYNFFSQWNQRRLNFFIKQNSTLQFSSGKF